MYIGRQFESLPSYGWYRNGSVNLGSNTNFPNFTYESSGGPDGGPYLKKTENDRDWESFQIVFQCTF